MPPLAPGFYLFLPNIRMSDSATTTKGKFRIGLAKWLGTLALVVYGGITSYGWMNSVSRVGGSVVGARLGTNTGQVLQVNGVTMNARDVIPLVMTGGKLNYNLAKVRLKDYGIVGSGVLLSANVHWKKGPAGGQIDIAISKCRSDASPNANSGTLLPNGNNLTTGTGTVTGLFGTGAVRVNGDDCIVVKSITNPTTSGSGYLMIEAQEDLSE